MPSRAPLSALLLVLLAAPAVRAGETNRFNLPEKPATPRFKVTEKTWPAQVGQAEICLWHDDKLAALSLGVDDNFAGEIDWWKKQAELYDFKVTWFAITGRIKNEGRSHGGVWSQFQELEELGHAVESHTTTHLHVAEPGWGTPEWDYEKAEAARGEAIRAARQSAAAPPKAGAATSPDNPEETASGKPENDTAKAPSIGKGRSPEELTALRESVLKSGLVSTPASLTPARLASADIPFTDPAKGVDWEYAHSIEQINANIPGKKASALAYPGGANTIYNDRYLAAKHFRVARGAAGSPNRANMTDYMATSALSGWDFDSQRGGNPRLVIDPSLYNGIYYRGWVILFAHGVTGSEPQFIKTFEFLKENRDKLWIGLYTDVAKYGQERDTATLAVTSSAADKITFQLTDEMDDSYFNFPLTVKVRIPNEWKEVSAAQAGKPAAVRILEHEGGAYALVQAVPDGGPVELKPKG